MGLVISFDLDVQEEKGRERERERETNKKQIKQHEVSRYLPISALFYQVHAAYICIIYMLPYILSIWNVCFVCI